MSTISKLLACVAVIAPCLLSADPAPKFALKDFEGSYFSYSVLSGGGFVTGQIFQTLAPNYALVGTLSSSATITQSSYDKNGNGTINFLSTTIWGAPTQPTFVVYSNNVVDPANDINPPLSYSISSVNLDDVDIHLYLTDANSGSGVTTLEGFPLSTDKLVSEFVAQKSGSKVTKFVTNQVVGTYNGFTSNRPPAGCGVVISERQV